MNTVLIILCVILAAGMTWFIWSCKKAPVIEYPEQLPEMSLCIKDIDFAEIKDFFISTPECESVGHFEFDYRIWAFQGTFRHEPERVWDVEITHITSVENQDYELGNDLIPKLTDYLTEKIKDRL